jgi:hypothetical protein
MLPEAGGPHGAPTRANRHLHNHMRSKHSITDGDSLAPSSSNAAGAAGWSDAVLDSGRLRDQGFRGRGGAPVAGGGSRSGRYDGYDLPPAPPERVEVPAQWPATLRSGADATRLVLC